MAADFDPHDFATLAEALHAAGSPAETAEEVVSFAIKELDADHGGITLIHSKRPLETVAPSDPVVAYVAELQDELHEGPCRDSAWADRTLVSRDLRFETRWPLWAPKAIASGIHSVLAAELSDVDGRRVGAIDLYWDKPRDFDRDDIGYAQIAARHAALALVNSIKEANLNVALDSRKRIGMAQGILIERYSLDPDRAFALLRRYSQDHNLKLREVADIVVRTRKLPSTSSPRGAAEES